MFLLQMQICFILPYNQIIKTNNQIIKMNNQIFKITVLRIHPRLMDVGSNGYRNFVYSSIFYEKVGNLTWVNC